MECFFFFFLNEMPSTSAAYFYDDLWCLIYRKKGNFTFWDLIFREILLKKGTSRIASHEFCSLKIMFVCMFVREFAEARKKKKSIFKILTNKTLW